MRLSMDNQNFIFLKDKSPEIYEVCCMVDAAYALSLENYKYPIVFSRMALEQSLKIKLKIKSKENRKLYQIINEYCEKTILIKKRIFINIVII